ncbi:MAG: Rad52/Rad22 family DNA repair protein [Armatimonadota bacterium]|nr:hypothetical protein [bacterium]
MTKSNNNTGPIDRDPKWEQIQAELSRPFDGKYISVRPGAVSDTGQAMLLWYVDARAVMARLDQAVGPENWSFSWNSVPTSEGRVAVHGQLSILGITKEDVGEAQDEDEPFKSAVSDAFKRCAVHFGLARYLYGMPQTWWPYDKSRRRFSNLSELDAFIESVTEKLVQAGGDPSQLNPRELQVEASSTSGRASQQPVAESTPAQQERIKDLQIHKFGTSPESRRNYDDFQKGVIGRVSKRSELKKHEADKIIKALMVLPNYREEAA